MKTWHKILIAPGIAIAFLLAFGAISYSAVAEQNRVLEDLTHRRMAGVTIVGDAAQDMSEVHSNVYRLFTWIANLDEAKIKQAITTQRQKIDAVAASLAKYRAEDHVTESERKALDAVLPMVAKYRKLADDAIDISSIEVAMGAMAMQGADYHFQAMLKELDKLVAIEKQLARESYEAAAASSRRMLMLLASILLVATVVSIAVALVMSRAIVRRLDVAIDAAKRIAGGDLATEVAAGKGTDETADLLRALEAMTRNLRRLVSEVSGSAHAVADTSAQIAQGNLDLSQRTEEQASTLEETASQMEELTSTVTQNADNARQASQMAADAADVARKGGDVVGQVVHTMSGISDSSRKIADIIGVIDGIAFQTNILALNAAVEAARAGEQGRGFAVVAAEVRSLAQRSATAAKEIKGLIADSVGKVDAGSRLVGNAGTTMNEIVQSVRKVSDIIAEIAAASQEQSAGIEQVNTAVTQMDQVVQQNASLVEEATAATESMREQAGSLLQSVSRFRLQQDGSGQPSARSHQAPAVHEAPHPAPERINVRPAAPQLPPAYAGVLAAAHANTPGKANGSWQQF
ncbi:MAG: chemotaxis protein [Ramlibacter sp.]|jgi:methyl-accepting chemotaxis protein|nr:chemotaxis protein [Ramlibacter sp.]MCE3273852.1 chemotaxis protein [Ramlibacter sp.]